MAETGPDNGLSLELAADQLMRIVTQILIYVRQHTRQSFDLTDREVRVLRRLNDRPLNMTEIAGVLQLSRPSATAVVDRLEQLGLVVRERQQRDGREKVVRLTGEGDEMGMRYHLAAFERFAALVECLSHAEIRALRTALTGLERVISESGASTSLDRTEAG